MFGTAAIYPSLEFRPDNLWRAVFGLLDRIGTLLQLTLVPSQDLRYDSVLQSA